MKLTAVPAFFRLVRWPNLLFISLTQSLFYFCVVIPSFFLGRPPHENILKLDDFSWVRADGTAMRPAVPRKVVQEFLDKGGRSEVVRLVSAYEQGIYGMKNLRTASSYEQRRLSALAEVSSAKLKAAAAASAIVFVPAKLAPGETVDGAIFLTTQGKVLGSGKLRVLTNGMLFDFNLTEEKPLAKPEPH